MKSIVCMGSPGSGKTTNLVKQINDAMSSGFRPEDICVLSHTKVAAKEIADRSGHSKVKTSTIHSLAYWAADIDHSQVVTTDNIKEFSWDLGFPMKGASGNSDDSLEIGDEYVAIINYAESVMMPYQWAYNHFNRPGRYSDFEYFINNYNHWKRIHGFCDFNDMLKKGIEHGREMNYKVVLIDEAQDLSKLQWSLINKITANSELIIVTGDPDQSLFLWGGADQEGMVRFAKQYKSKIAHIDQSYRVPKVAHAISKLIISQVKNRYEKDYKSTDNDGKLLCYSDISYLPIDVDDDVLVLYRNHALRREIEEEFRFKGIPYTILNGGRGLCQNKYSRGIESLRDIKNGNMSQGNIKRVEEVASPVALTAIKKGEFEKLQGMSPSIALNIPASLMGYYRNADISKARNIKLSTIHGAKGMEANTVIVLDGITQRVMEEYEVNPDPERQVWYVAVTRTKNNLIVLGSRDGRPTEVLRRIM